MQTVGQTPSIPRKGTETVSAAARPPFTPGSDTLNSPQGDGNSLRDVLGTFDVPVGSDTLNSPQGDGNRPSLPERQWRSRVRHPQFPARGRKPCSWTARVEAPSTVRHPQFPARGRKHKQVIPRQAVLDSLSDTLNSPQGDGNSTPRGVCLLGSAWCQTPSIPRKGTETLMARGKFSVELSTVRHPQFPARGRKRTRPESCSSPESAGQTPSIPRKGTETSQWPPAY